MSGSYSSGQRTVSGSPKGQQTMQPTNNTNTNMNNMVVNIGSIPIASRSQLPWILRALYFLLIGWWFSAIWIVLAWLIAITILLVACMLPSLVPASLVSAQEDITGFMEFHTRRRDRIGSRRRSVLGLSLIHISE